MSTPHRRGRKLTCTLFVAALLGGGGAAAPSTEFSLTGGVATPSVYDLAKLQARPDITQTVGFLAGSTPQTRTYTGASLWGILDSAGIAANPAVKNDLLNKYVLATGSDGYQAVFSLGELSSLFGNQPDLIAYAGRRRLARRRRLCPHRRAERREDGPLGLEPGQPRSLQRRAGARARFGLVGGDVVAAQPIRARPCPLHPSHPANPPPRRPGSACASPPAGSSPSGRGRCCCSRRSAKPARSPPLPSSSRCRTAAPDSCSTSSTRRSSNPRSIRPRVARTAAAAR